MNSAADTKSMKANLNILGFISNLLNLELISSVNLHSYFF